MSASPAPSGGTMSVPGTPPRRPAKRDPSSLALSSIANNASASTSTSISANRNSGENGSIPSGTVRADIKPRDPIIERALQLSTFESNYSTEDFIGTLSEKLISESKVDPGPFNPKPFLQTFSPALDSLLSLRQQVAERTKKMETDVRRAEREYGRRLRELDGGFEAIGNSFENLESKITDVGRTAVRMGEQLDTLHQTRSTAQSTSLLLSYYLSLAHQTSISSPDGTSSTPLEVLFATRTSREGRSRLAVILRRLMAVSKDVADNATALLNETEQAQTPKEPNGNTGTSTTASDAPVSAKAIGKRKMEKEKAERVRDEIERYCEKFEKEVLRLFDRSYRKGDPRMMAHCAKTLQDFNGGASCVQIYVNQHDFFISKDRLLEEAVRLDTSPLYSWTTIGDPDAPPPITEPGMEALLKEIRVTVSQEAQIVKAVFPNPSAVFQVFLQRVFAQVIQQHLESLLTRASTTSTLAVLRILHLTHSICSSLVEDLKTYDLTLGAETAGLSKAPTTASGPLATMLDHALEEMFIPWLEGSRYLESESKNLVELYAGLLSRFTRYHETVLKAKPNSILDKVVNQLQTSSSAATSSSTAQTAAAAISKYANLFTSKTGGTSTPIPGQQVKPYGTNAAHLGVQGGGGTKSAMLTNGTQTPVAAEPRPGLPRQDTVLKGELINKGLEDKVWLTDGVLTIEMAERMLKWHAEAVGRAVELSASGDIGKNALSLSKVLSEAIGRSFVETALDSALARLDNQETRSAEPDLQPLTVIKPSDQICHLWQRYTSTALLPLSGTVMSIRREMNTINSHNVVRMEGKINSVIQKALDGIVSYLSYLLTKQKKNDYKPKNDELSFARTNTEPCELCTDFLVTIRDTVNEALSGKNAEAFLTEVGVAFHSLLLDHYKKFPVNPTGGLMLTKDLASYQETMSSYGIQAVNDRFDMLRQLGNSFIVQPNVLKSYMTESHLGRIELRLLKPYLTQRSDYSQFSKLLQLDDSTAGNEDHPSSSSPLSISSTISSTMLNRSHSRASGLGKAGSRLSTMSMSGVAGAGMGKLKEMLKEFDTMTPEESANARKLHNSQRGGYQPMFYMGLH
uniref:Exocyst complex component protein n=1 Tax=Kwoniella pini CBS 10737 TaxID=1296096 RepID=A0A1B9HVY6_9TREE|nr:exocyst complex component protein [Kwoniella pini CBS 10737]OCF47418.1 exocyst complex component protein [Kwoniella pini CBS 10737]